MKKIITLCLFFGISQISYAQKAEKCMDQLIRYYNVAKMRGIFLNTANEEAQGKEGNSGVNPRTLLDNSEMCSRVPKENQDSFEEGHIQKMKTKSLVVQEFSRKKKIESFIFSGLSFKDPKPEITEEDVCNDAHKASQVGYDCDGEKFLLQASSQIANSDAGFQEKCKKLQPLIVASEKKAADCEEAKVKARQPGEEISQDEPNTKNEKPVTQVTPTSPYDKLDSSNPLKKYSRGGKMVLPSSGGSGQ